MSLSEMKQPARRRFIAQLSGGLAALAGFAAPARGQATAGRVNPEHDAWMQRAQGEHRQFFHATSPADGAAMLMAANYLDVYASAYAARPEHVSAVIGVHGSALPIGLVDAVWSKYELGKRISITDPDTKEPAKRNIFAVGGPISIDTVMRRGVVLLVCNVALTRFSGSIATALSVPHTEVYNDLKAAVLPGAVIVPALVIAMNRAQEKGFTYVRAS